MRYSLLASFYDTSQRLHKLAKPVMCLLAS